MAKDTKGIGKDTLSDTQAPLDEQETVETVETAQEQQNDLQTKEEEQQENKDMVKYKSNYKMLITDIGTFTADKNGYFLLTKEQYNKIMKNKV